VKISKKCLRIINEPLWIITKSMFNKPKVHHVVKRMLKDYQRALEDLDNVDVLEPNNAFILKNREDVKYMLYDY